MVPVANDALDKWMQVLKFSVDDFYDLQVKFIIGRNVTALWLIDTNFMASTSLLR